MTTAPRIRSRNANRLGAEVLALVKHLEELARRDPDGMGGDACAFARDLATTHAVYGYEGLSLAQIWHAADIARRYQAAREAQPA